MLIIVNKKKFDALLEAAISALDEIQNYMDYDHKYYGDFKADLDRVATDLRLSLSDLIEEHL